MNFWPLWLKTFGNFWIRNPTQVERLCHKIGQWDDQMTTDARNHAVKCDFVVLSFLFCGWLCRRFAKTTSSSLFLATWRSSFVYYPVGNKREPTQLPGAYLMVGCVSSFHPDQEQLTATLTGNMKGEPCSKCRRLLRSQSRPIRFGR